MASNSIDTTQNARLSEKEKHVLIGFLRDSESSFRNNEEKLATKEDLVKLFDGKYEEKILEKTFHSLRVGFARELRKHKDKSPRRNGSVVIATAFFSVIFEMKELLICFNIFVSNNIYRGDT